MLEDILKTTSYLFKTEVIIKIIIIIIIKRLIRYRNYFLIKKFSLYRNLNIFFNVI